MPDALLDEYDAHSVVKAVAKAERADTTTDPATFDRCPALDADGEPCLSTRIHSKPGRWYPQKKDGAKKCRYAHHFDIPVAPPAAFDAAEPVCPECESPRLRETTHGRDYECMDCGARVDEAADATSSPLMRQRIREATETYRSASDELAPDMGRHAALVAYCRVAKAAQHAHQFAAAVEPPTDPDDDTDTMSDAHAFEWIDTNDLKRPAERVRAQPPESDDELAEFVLRLYRPWNRRDGDPSYYDIAAMIPYSACWVGDRVREWKERTEQAGEWPTVERPSVSTDTSSMRAAADGGRRDQ